MPPLALHTVVAKEVADRLGHPILDAERGNLYLGSTSPDIRVITRRDRRLTHFFDLSCFEEQSGVAELLRTCPELADIGRLRPATVAFIAGYISHLVMDETWIIDIYRPFFGERSSLAGALKANIKDRAIQFALDQEKRADNQLMAHVLDELARSDLALEVNFIDGETLARWRGIIIDLARRPLDWEIFRYAATRHLRESGIDGEAAREYAQALPDIIEATRKYLSEERIQTVLDDSRRRSLEAVKEYLCV
jgi:hypothetical protein